MTFKDKYWIPYKKPSSSNILEVNIRNKNDNRIVEQFYLKEPKNTRDIKRIVKTIKDKYVFDLSHKNEKLELLKKENNFLDKDKAF